MIIDNSHLREIDANDIYHNILKELTCELYGEDYKGISDNIRVLGIFLLK